jgi:hypothetical protein
MKSPALSAVAQTSHATSRSIVQSLLVAMLMLGVIEFPVHAQGAPEEAQSKIEQPNRSIKVRLKRSGLRDEWIRVEIGNDGTDQTVRAYHTSQVKNQFLSTLATVATNFGAESLASEIIKDYEGPVFTPDISFYRWVDHPTQRLTFIPEGCDATIIDPKSTCVIRGTDTLKLPTDTKIESGQLTIEYIEESLARSVTLSIPSESK